MFFLNRLKKQGVKITQPIVAKATSRPIGKNVTELLLDVSETKHEIVIFAQVPGADIDDISISVEGDADIIIIEGRQLRPEQLVFSKKELTERVFHIEECQWGNFYRRIILPESIHMEKTEARIKDGVLLLTLPLLSAQKKRK